MQLATNTLLTPSPAAQLGEDLLFQVTLPLDHLEKLKSYGALDAISTGREQLGWFLPRIPAYRSSLTDYVDAIVRFDPSAAPYAPAARQAIDSWIAYVMTVGSSDARQPIGAIAAMLHAGVNDAARGLVSLAGAVIGPPDIGGAAHS